MFGSHARGDNHEESDIDFAVVLKEPDVHATAEIFKISGITALLGLKYGVMLSTFPTSHDNMRKSMQGIYQNIRREGIVI